MIRHSLLTSLLIGLAAAGFISHAEPAPAGDHDMRGQVAGWHKERRNRGEWYYISGIRYIPQLSLMWPLATDRLLELETVLNGFASIGSTDADEDYDLKLYRLKLRFATAQTETRLGLQKLNFGPAQLLRSLMWFDRLDPRDPLKLTDGVYALRFKYDALNNSSLWLWVLYGNNDTKGFEVFPTADGKPEFGGRLEYPVPSGEMALTFHSRTVDVPVTGIGDLKEYRFALDGRWDIKIGLWFESVLQQRTSSILPLEWTKLMTLGMDYTFGTGNGVHILFEHMAIVFSDDPFEWKEDTQTSAFSINYPIGYMDKLSAIGFYSWENEKYHQYMSWQRTWDNLIVNLGLFHYPELDTNGGLDGPYTSFSGYGGQVTVIYNH